MHLPFMFMQLKIIAKKGRISMIHFLNMICLLLSQKGKGIFYILS